jgi:hypothetical protein
LPRTRIPIAKLGIYGLGVSSDLIAEVGAGFLKVIPLAVRRAWLFLFGVLAFEYHILIIMMVGIMLVAILWEWRKKHPRKRVIQYDKTNLQSTTRYCKVRVSYHIGAGGAQWRNR